MILYKMSISLNFITRTVNSLCVCFLLQYFHLGKSYSFNHRNILPPKLIDNISSSINSKFHLENVKSFTNFHYYFKTSLKQARGRKTDKLVFYKCSNKGKYCHDNMISNTTQVIIDQHLKYCTNEFYSPRIVKPTQISWKRVQRQQNKLNQLLNNKSANNTFFNTTQNYFNKTLNALINDYRNFHKQKHSKRHQNDDDNDDDEEDDDDSDNSNLNTHTKKPKNETVHKFMAFGLLLPSHPFSQDMFHHLKIVAPMFPQVKLVIGNANQFKYLCNQYAVSSFPQLLFFTKG